MSVTRDPRIDDAVQIEPWRDVELDDETIEKLRTLLLDVEHERERSA